MKQVCTRFRTFLGKTADLLGRFRLRTVWIGILILALILLSVSIYSSNQIAKNLIQSDYQEYNETIFDQARSEINRNIQSLTRLCYMAMSNHALVEYLEETSFNGRSEIADEMMTALYEMITFQQDIRGIFLYDLKGDMIASLGDALILDSTEADITRITFVWNSNTAEKNLFEVIFPIFDVDDSLVVERVGTCKLLVDIDFLEDSIAEILPNDDYFCLILNGDSQIMLSKGDIPETLTDQNGYFSAAADEDISTELYQGLLHRTDWEILFGVPQTELYAGINQLQNNYYSTYLIIIFLLMLLFAFTYGGMLRPIQAMARFMQNYAAKPTQRMEVKSRNEMGELADNLNHMLDQIETLTNENIQSKEKVLEAEYQKKQSELLAYRSQINPHFMYNTFECIRGMALYHHVEDIAAITEALSRLFSYNLYGNGYAPIREVESYIYDYRSIVRYRFDNRFEIHIYVQEETKDILFPKMVVQPIVENAIFHGLETVEHNGNVFVSITREDERLNIVIRDDGIGISEKELHALRQSLKDYDNTNNIPVRKHGIGLLNVYRRLNLFYGDDLIFCVDSVLGEGTTVKINVPCDTSVGEGKNVPSFFD